MRQMFEAENIRMFNEQVFNSSNIVVSFFCFVNTILSHQTDDIWVIYNFEKNTW